jgi:hypothetical protein
VKGEVDMSEWKEFLSQELLNPELRAEWDALAPEFTALQAEIDAKEDAAPKPRVDYLPEQRISV